MSPTFPVQSDTLPAPAMPCRGFDVSRYSGDVDFARFKREGFDFVIIRSSVKTTLDARFQQYVKAARAADLIVGPYHAFFDDGDPKKQAKFFFDVCKEAGLTEKSRKTLLPSNDFEMFHAGNGKPSAVQKFESTNLALVFQQETERLWEIDTSIFYSYPSFVDSIPACASKTDLAKRKLWIAHYTANRPKVPKPFTEWTIWQHQGNVTMNGAYVDLNESRGGVETLPTLSRSATSHAPMELGLQLGNQDTVAATTLADEVHALQTERKDE